MSGDSEERVAGVAHAVAVVIFEILSARFGELYARRP